VVWKRTGTHSSANRRGPVHDVLLMYAKKRGSQTWNRPYVPLGAEHKRRHYSQKDDQGRPYTHGELTAPGVRNGRSGAVCRAVAAGDAGLRAAARCRSGARRESPRRHRTRASTAGRQVKAIQGTRDAFLRYRVGDYRLLYEIHDDGHVVLVAWHRGT